MSLIISLIIGGFVGWLAARVAGRREGVIASVVIGVVGSIIGGILSRLFSGTNQAYLTFSWIDLFWSFIGALILVSILNAVQQHTPHQHTGI